MTVGENIQRYRKSLGLSQEELGQKLLVSRQTISLWEKDQTVPTIDNLMRLKEIFRVSIDEILDPENKMQITEAEPNESYTFNFTKEELDEINSLQKKSNYKNLVVFTLLSALLIFLSIAFVAPDTVIGFTFGVAFMGILAFIKGIRAYGKSWKNSAERIYESTYEYKIFDNYIAISIYRKGEKVRESKCSFNDIEQVNINGRWLFFQIVGQAFIVRRSDLKENSAFYSYMYKNPTKTVENSSFNRWRTISIILFVASLFSVLGGLILVGEVSSINNLFIENMWLFFLMTPIPVFSTVFGCILKAKGYKYKKNIVAGIIMTILLCIYGSFTFIF